MRTEHLLQTLPKGLLPVSRRAIPERLMKGAIAGSLACLAAVVGTLGMRPDLRHAILNFPFWMKWTYTSSFAAIGFYLSATLARPERSASRQSLILLLPIGGLLSIAIFELAHTPRNEWLLMLLGGSWKACSPLLLLLSVPTFAGLCWAFRSFAPTSLRAAGAVLGVAASASSATLYSLHCPEVSALFILTWYTLGFLVAGIVGALLGPRLLRW